MEAGGQLFSQGGDHSPGVVAVKMNFLEFTGGEMGGGQVVSKEADS